MPIEFEDLEVNTAGNHPQQSTTGSSSRASLSVKDLINNYEKERSQATVKDAHERQTFLVSKELINKLTSLQAYIEVSNAKGSKIFNNDRMTEEKFRRERKLLTGFKTKFINTALNALFKEWERENGDIPDVEMIRYRFPNTDSIYRVFLFKRDGKYHFIKHDDSGNEIEHYSGTEKEVRERFEECRSLEIKNGRPKK